MALAELIRENALSWLQPGGPEGDVALSSRIRLARNFRRIPFPGRADFQQLKEVADMASSLLGDLEDALDQPFDAVDMNKLTSLEREVLIEKHLISQNFIKHPQHRLAFVSADRRVSMMVNEEDHLRIQCMESGLDLAKPYTMASGIDDMVEAKLDLAFDESMGYLTSCPTNLGTGLRASVLLHLPGLVYTRNISNIINISTQLGLSVRGLYGDDQEVVGNLFRISNQLTLGFSEKEIMENLGSAVTEIASHERRARKALHLYRKERLEDEVWRAYGTLCYARCLSQKEALELLSKVRLGIDIGLIDEVDARCYAELLIGGRTSCLQNIAGNDNMSGAELDRLRADTLRHVLLRYRQARRGKG